MDELLEELGLSYNDLHKLHTGHYLNKESDESDSSDGTHSLDEDLKPPPFTFDEIQKNVRSIDVQESVGNVKNSIIVSTTEEISKKLSLYITPDKCFLCNKWARTHYKKAKHYREVRSWLRQEVANITEEIKLSNFFCEVCNLVLCGNDLAQKHYWTREHLIKSREFCLPCLRKIPEHDMSLHLKSRTHEVGSLKNALPDEQLTRRRRKKNTTHLLKVENKDIEHDLEQIDNQGLLSEPKEESIEGKENDVTLGANALETNCIKNNAMCTPNKDIDETPKYKILTDYRALAVILMDMLTSSVCYVCNSVVKGTHYNESAHNLALELWIKTYVKAFGFYLKDIDELICFACHAIFPGKEYADIHYNSSGHLSQSRKFCKVCLRHLVGKRALNHINDPQHINLDAIRKIEKERNHKIITLEDPTINPSFGKMENRIVESFKIHGVDVDVVRALLKGNEPAQCDPVAKSVLVLMTPTYCFICNKSALKNNKGQFKHYTYLRHEQEVKKFLEYKVAGSQISLESLYCDACNEIFINNKLAAEHYNTPEHKKSLKYTCLPRFSPPMNESSNKLESNQPVLKNELEIGNKENTSAINQTGKVITDKLKDLLSPTFCFICKKYVNMHMFNHHYLERDHTVKIRNWLDNEIKKSGVQIDKNILYCEDCSLELNGTNEDLKHYETVGHQLNKNKYCSICIFRGSANEVSVHISSNLHKNNSVKLSEKTENTNTSWPKKLTKLITFHECKVCCEKLQTTEKADIHYSSERHNNNVRNWLDHFHQFGDKAEDIPNEEYKAFTCTFCEFGFISEQQLNEHKNSHFPTLGAIQSHDPYKTLKNITSNPQKQKSSPQKMAKEKTLLTSSDPNTKSVSLAHPNKPKEKDNRKDDNAKYYEKIRIEINKLINTVYVLKLLPLDQSLRHLQELNKKLASYKRPFDQVGQLCEKELKKITENKTTEKTEKMGSNRPNTSKNDEITEQDFLSVPFSCITDVTAEEYTKTKLSMEIYRLKMVIGNGRKIRAEFAFKYVHNLNQLLEESIGRCSTEFDFESVFEGDENPFISLIKIDKLEGNIQGKLCKLEETLLDAEKISTELALYFITNFNVRLETFLEYQ